MTGGAGSIHNERRFTMVRKKAAKKEVYFIATKYKNKPAEVTFYTEKGDKVPEKVVEKVPTRDGVHLYTLG